MDTEVSVVTWLWLTCWPTSAGRALIVLVGYKGDTEQIGDELDRVADCSPRTMINGWAWYALKMLKKGE